MYYEFLLLSVDNSDYAISLLKIFQWFSSPTVKICSWQGWSSPEGCGFHQSLLKPEWLPISYLNKWSLLPLQSFELSVPCALHALPKYISIPHLHASNFCSNFTPELLIPELLNPFIDSMYHIKYTFVYVIIIWLILLELRLHASQNLISFVDYWNLRA